MANWIKAIYFVVILAWVIYVLSDDAVKYKSFPRRFGLSVALTVIIGLAGFALWHAAVPTSIKLLSEDSEVAEQFPGFPQDRISPRRQGGAFLRLSHGTG